MRRVALSLLGLLISAVAVYFVVRSVDLGQTLDTMARAQASLLLATLPLIAIGIILRSLRWQRLLPAGSSVPVARIAPVLLIGYLGNAVLPARMGEPIRAYLLARREGLSSALVFGTALLERIVDLGTLAVIAFVAAIILRAPGWAIDLTGIAAAGGAGIVLLLALAGLEAPLRMLRRFVERRRAGQQAALFAPFEHFAQGIGGAPQRVPVAQAVLLSVPIWLIDGTICWLVSQSLGTGLSLVASVLIVGVGALGTSIPSAPGYVGTYELAVSSVAIALGTSPQAALGLAVLLHVTTLLPVAIAGAGSLLALGNGNLFALARVAQDRER